MKTDSITLADGALEDITLRSGVKGAENPKTGLVGLSGNADRYLSVLQGATWLDISLLDDEDEFASKIVFLAHFDEDAAATTFSDATGFTFGRSIGAAHTVDGVDAEFGRRLNLTSSGILSSLSTLNQGFSLGSSDFTITCRITRLATSSGSTIISNWYGGSAANCSLSLGLAAGSIQPALGIGYGSTNVSISMSTSTVDIPVNVETEIAFERYGTKINFYVNGQLASTGNLPSAVTLNLGAAKHQYIGARSDYAGVNCNLDEVCITKVARFKGMNYTPRTAPYSLHPSIDAANAFLHLDSTYAIGTAGAPLDIYPNTWSISGAISGLALGYTDGSRCALFARSNGVIYNTTIGNVSTRGFTVQAKAYASALPTVSGEYGTIVSKDTAYPSTDRSLLLSLYKYPNTGVVSFCASLYFSDGTSYVLTTDSAPKLAVWYDVALTYDGTTYRLFVDGLLVDSYESTKSIRTSTAPWRIGNGSSLNSSTAWAGRIKNVLISTTNCLYTTDFVPEDL